MKYSRISSVGKQSKGIVESLGFNPLYDNILRRIINNINNNSLHIDIYSDNEASFIKRLDNVYKLKVRTADWASNHNYPKINFTSVTVTSGELKDAHGFSAEMYKANNTSDPITFIKAKAEFLERISCVLPLDESFKYDFNRVKTYDSSNDKVAVLKSVLPGHGVFGVVKSKLALPVPLLYFRLAPPYYSDTHSSKSSKSILAIGNKEPHISSNGCAGHFDQDKAVLSAWLELIQRDGFLMYWLNTVSPRVIDIDGYLDIDETGKVAQVRGGDMLSESKYNDLQRLVLDLKKYKVEYYVLDITSDIKVPNVLCLIRTQYKGGWEFSLGAGTGFDADSAILSGLLEALANTSNRHNKVAVPFDMKSYVPFTDTNMDKDRRQTIYYNDNMQKQLEFLIANHNNKDNTISVSDWINVNGYVGSVGFDIHRLCNDAKSGIKYLKHIYAEMAKHNTNYNVYIYNYKNKLIQSFDFKVVRVICPAMYSLYLQENYADPDHPRLAEFVKNEGLEAIVKRNIWPHPFP